MGMQLSRPAKSTQSSNPVSKQAISKYPTHSASDSNHGSELFLQGQYSVTIQEIPHTLRNPRGHYRLNKNSPTFPNLTQINPVHFPTPYFLNGCSYINITLSINAKFFQLYIRSIFSY
jgi:hypothetical protein